MLSRRRCPFCRRWFYPHPRLKQRQKTCGRTDCRHKQKRKSNQLLYFVLVAVSNQDGVSFYSDARLAELLDIRFLHELEAARNELVARDLIAYADGIYQVLDLPADSPRKTRDASSPLPDHASRSSSSSRSAVLRTGGREAASDLESVKQLLERWGWGRK
jgi:hypothetical protein